MGVKIRLLKNTEVGYEPRLSGWEGRVDPNTAINLIRAEKAELVGDAKNDKNEAFVVAQIQDEVKNFTKIREELKKPKKIKKDGID